MLPANRQGFLGNSLSSLEITDLQQTDQQHVQPKRLMFYDSRGLRQGNSLF